MVEASVDVLDVGELLLSHLDQLRRMEVSGEASQSVIQTRYTILILIFVLLWEMEGKSEACWFTSAGPLSREPKICCTT